MQFLILLGLVAYVAGAALYTTPNRDSVHDARETGAALGDGFASPEGSLFESQPRSFSSGSSGSNPAIFSSSDNSNGFLSGPVSPVNPHSGQALDVRAGGLLFGAASSGNNALNAASGNLFPTDGSGSLSLGVPVPQYEEHFLPRSGVIPRTRTIINKATKTHTLRVPSTSDVWVTSIKMVKVPVTRFSTHRSYVPELSANTVTSFIRITQTPIAFETRTAVFSPTKTVVSVFTNFVTETRTVELWQPIVHRAISYEVMTAPVLETQILLQRLFTTTTITSFVNKTSVRQAAGGVPRSGSIPASRAHHY